MKIKIRKEQFDKLIDGLNNMITDELNQIKANIDINNDGYVEFKEFKTCIKIIIKGLKKAIRGLR